MKITIGLEAVIDISDCNTNNIHDYKYLQKIMYYIAKTMKTTIVGEIHHQFTPHGITIMAIVADSHIAIHTWPEYNHVSIDIFSCNKYIPETLINYLGEILYSKDIKYHFIERKTNIKSNT
ncbi:MAG: adenosylmethionine decarboxylase [Coprobacillaceae bacterium]